MYIPNRTIDFFKVDGRKGISIEIIARSRPKKKIVPDFDPMTFPVFRIIFLKSIPVKSRRYADTGTGENIFDEVS